MKQNNSTTSNIFIGFFLLMTMIIQGCAAVKTQGGFVEDQTKLTPCKADTSKRWWEKPGFDWRNYNGVIIESIALEIDHKN